MFSVGHVNNDFFFFADSRITASDNRNLTISHMEPKDTKNYTCVPIGKSESHVPFVHYVIGKVSHKVRVEYVEYVSQKVQGCSGQRESREYSRWQGQIQVCGAL